MLFETPDWDRSLQLLLNQEWRSGLMDALAPVLSASAVLFVPLALVALWLLVRRDAGRLAVLLAMVAAIGLADLGCNAAKSSIGRVRPLNAVAGTWLHEGGKWTRRPPDYVQTKEHGSSYVSSHAANTMAVAVILASLWPGIGAALGGLLRYGVFLLPLAVGYSRVYLGKHYPLDVAAGWLVGLVAALVIRALYRAFAVRFLSRKQ